eukprot:448896-Amphidinium_carterae.1
MSSNCQAVLFITLHCTCFLLSAAVARTGHVALDGTPTRMRMDIPHFDTNAIWAYFANCGCRGTDFVRTTHSNTAQSMRYFSRTYRSNGTIYGHTDMFSKPAPKGSKKMRLQAAAGVNHYKVAKGTLDRLICQWTPTTLTLLSQLPWACVPMEHKAAAVRF